jgi:23S rRNA (guanosine2251-2'-O)-methyltransferase
MIAINYLFLEINYMKKKTAPVGKKKSAPQGELIIGIHPLIELLKAKRRKLISIYTTKPTPKAWAEIEKLMPKYPVNIQYVAREVLHKMGGTTDHQGVISWVMPYQFRKTPFEAKNAPFLLMLDGIQDVHNLGAILRTAYCTGVDGVVLTKKNSAPLNAAALKASAGLAEHLQIYVAPSAEAAALELKQAGYEIYLATFGGTNATKVSYAQPCCIVIGGEGFGISKQIYRHGTQITLPQQTADISYNASVAAGILLFLASTKNGRIK